MSTSFRRSPSRSEASKIAWRMFSATSSVRPLRRAGCMSPPVYPLRTSSPIVDIQKVSNLTWVLSIPFETINVCWSSLAVSIEQETSNGKVDLCPSNAVADSSLAFASLRGPGTEGTD